MIDRLAEMQETGRVGGGALVISEIASRQSE